MCCRLLETGLVYVSDECWSGAREGHVFIIHGMGTMQHLQLCSINLSSPTLCTRYTLTMALI